MDDPTASSGFRGTIKTGTEFTKNQTEMTEKKPLTYFYSQPEAGIILIT